MTYILATPAEFDALTEMELRFLHRLAPEFATRGIVLTAQPIRRDIVSASDSHTRPGRAGKTVHIFPGSEIDRATALPVRKFRRYHELTLMQAGYRYWPV